MEVETLDFEESFDIQKRRKVRLAEIANARRSSVAEDESPFSEENMKHATRKRVMVKGQKRKDIQNIGSGTRCLSCGCLHFCWTPNCGACGKPISFNLGHHSVRGGR